MISAKVAQLPGLFKEVALEDGATVAQAVTAACLNADGFAIRVNGSVSDLGATLRNGDTITLSKAAKGNG